MVGHARDARVHFGAAQLLRAHHLAGGRLHQRRPAEEDRALALDDDGLVRHRRHVRAACGAGAHDRRDLRDAGGRKVGHVEEDAPEVLAVGEHVVLVGQVRAARVHQVDARQAVLQRHLLRTQVLLHRHRKVGAALHRRVVAHDDALAPGDAAHARDDAGARRLAVVHAVGGELPDLEEGRPRVEERPHALARQELAARRVLGARRLVAAERRLRHLLAQVRHQPLHARGVGAELRAARVEMARQDAHGAGDCRGSGRSGQDRGGWNRRWPQIRSQGLRSAAIGVHPRQEERSAIFAAWRSS